MKSGSVLPKGHSAVLTSILLRFISVAGWRPMEKQKRPAGRMQALFRKKTPPCQLRFRFAPSQSRAGALWKSRNDQPEECRHSSARRLRRANFDSASLHLSRGLSPYGKAETTSRKNASTLPQEDSAVPTSIPLRSISVAGYRPMEKQKRPAGRMQALFRLVVSAFPHGSMPSRKLQLPCIQLIVGSF